jgi:hypothetical protein
MTRNYLISDLDTESGFTMPRSGRQKKSPPPRTGYVLLSSPGHLFSDSSPVNTAPGASSHTSSDDSPGNTDPGDAPNKESDNGQRQARDSPFATPRSRREGACRGPLEHVLQARKSLAFSEASSIHENDVPPSDPGQLIVL